LVEIAQADALKAAEKDPDPFATPARKATPTPGGVVAPMADNSMARRKQIEADLVNSKMELQRLEGSLAAATARVAEWQADAKRLSDAGSREKDAGRKAALTASWLYATSQAVEAGDRKRACEVAVNGAKAAVSRLQAELSLLK
jgi:multidrug resistance efflux pump